MKKEGRYRYLFHNMALFTVSSFVSKVLVFFLVPFYTSILTESEYGIADVMQSTLLLLVPLLSINAGEAALRFGLEEVDRRDEILKIGLKRVLRSIVVLGLMCFIIGSIVSIPQLRAVLPYSDILTDLPKYLILFFFLYVCDSFYEYMLLYCQGTEEVQIMITGSVSCTILVIASNLCFLLILRLGLLGYLLAQMLSFFGAFLLMYYLIRKVRNESEVSPNLEEADLNLEVVSPNLEEDSSNLEKEMYSYGRSMLLYSTASWINNAIDRYYILFMLGSVYNGLYGVAYRIPAILTTFQRIFAQAWQMSAVKEYKGEDREDFFSGMYRTYAAVLVIGSGVIILFLKGIAALLFRGAFFSAWDLVPPLLLAVVFGALEGFLGSICLAFKDGKSMGIATGTGAIVNIILNFFLIGLLGNFGAALATMASYFVMYALSCVFVRRHVKLRMLLIRDLAAYLLLIIESAVIIYNINRYFIINAGIVLALAALYFKEVTIVTKQAASMVTGHGRD